MPTYKEAWEKGGKALSDKYGGDFSKFESAARRYNATKNEGGKPGTYKTNMKDFALNSQARRDEYDRRGWQHDKTTEVSKKPNNKAVGNNSNISKITASLAEDMTTHGPGSGRLQHGIDKGMRREGSKNMRGSSNTTVSTTDSGEAYTATPSGYVQKYAAIDMTKDINKPGKLRGADGLDLALASKFGKNSATSTSNMSLMKSKVDDPKGVVSQKGTTPKESSSKQSSPTTLGTSRDPEVDNKGREKIGGASYQSGDSYERFGKGSVKTKGKGTKRERKVHYNEEGKKLGTVKRGEDKFDIKKTKRGKAADSARRVEAGQGTAEDAKYVMKNDKSKTPSARKIRKANKGKSGDNYKVGSVTKGLASGYTRGGNSSF